MNCRNCDTSITVEDNFCPICGARVITERITLRGMVLDFAESTFGWDSRYFSTLRDLTIRPQKVIKEYVAGTRKRYMNPFSYYAIAVAISLLCITFLSEDFFKVFEKTDQVFQEMFAEDASMSLNSEVVSDSTVETLSEKEVEENQRKAEINHKLRTYQDNFPKFFLKYYNVISFLSLPIYALLALWVFGKPYNYGEHAVINAYLQGHTTIFSMIFLGVGVLSQNLTVYSITFFLMIVYYIVVYQGLYKFKPLKLIWKVIKFFVIIIFSGFLLVVVPLGIAIALKKLGVI